MVGVFAVPTKAAKTGLGRGLRALLALAAVGLAGYLLHRTLGRYSIDEILRSMASIPLSRMSLSLACAGASYLCLTAFDWLALCYVDKRLPYRHVALASFCSLSLGHNIGFAALSSGAIRYRFYARWGVELGDIAKIILFCGVTVGLGLIVLAGIALSLNSGPAAEMTGIPRHLIVFLGCACLALAASYLALAAFVRKEIRFRRWSARLPSWRLAIAQLIVGPLNFSFVSACLYQALASLGDVAYLQVATAYVIGLAGALFSHVPGGLGVIEMAVTVLLPDQQLIGGLVAFRVIYFLIPLSVGLPLFALSELLFRRSAHARRD